MLFIAYSVLSLLTLTAAQAPANPPPSGRPAPAPPAGAPPKSAPLEPAAPDANPLISLIQSGFANPAFTPNPLISLIQSGFKNPAFTSTPTPTHTTDPLSSAPSSISSLSFAQTLSPNPSDPDSTPGEVLLCTSTTYSSWSGDAADGICDAVHSPLNTCRNLSAALRKRVTAVRPDKGQLCLFFDDEDCYGKAEWVKWPGVRNLRGRIGDGGAWAGRIVSFRCSTED